MSLQDALNTVTRTAPAAKNRVDILLERLEAEAPEDYATLYAALHNTLITGASLTRALRTEYGADVVKDYSVDRWRRTRNTELTGL